MHRNTRFVGDPFSKALNKSQIQQAAALNAQVTIIMGEVFTAQKPCVKMSLKPEFFV